MAKPINDEYIWKWKRNTGTVTSSYSFPPLPLISPLRFVDDRDMLTQVGRSSYLEWVFRSCVGQTNKQFG